MNVDTANDVSYATDYKLYPEPTRSDVTKLAAGDDPCWIGYSNSHHPQSPTKVQTHLRVCDAEDRLSSPEHYRRTGHARTYRRAIHQRDDRLRRGLMASNV